MSGLQDLIFFPEVQTWFDFALSQVTNYIFIVTNILNQYTYVGFIVTK